MRRAEAAGSAAQPLRCKRIAALSLIEVSDARALAGDLFRNAFKAEIPRFPRHFVLLNAATPARSIGYVHYTKHGTAQLAGGLVVSALEIRRFDAETLAAVRAQGGLAELIMRTTTELLDDADAVFAYMGDPKSITVNLLVGFERTRHKYLYVLWKRRLEVDRQIALVERVAQLGPF